MNVISTTTGCERTLNTSTNTNTSGSSKSTTCPSGTHFATSCIIVGLLKVVWLRIRASILYLCTKWIHHHKISIIWQRRTLNFCDGSWRSKKDLNMRWHSDWISGILVTQEPDTGTKRWAYLELEMKNSRVNGEVEAYFVCVMPDRFTFCTCVVTSCTGSIGSLHEMKITTCMTISC